MFAFLIVIVIEMMIRG